MQSAPRTDDILWEMMIRVRVWARWPMVSQISFSLSGSTLEVASSKIMYSAFDKRALAIPIFWRWPPEREAPAFPTSEFSPFSSDCTNFKSPASFTASIKVWSSASGSARSRFSRMVPEKRFTCWGTMAMCFLSSSGFML